jgi:hypothetical protein
MQEGALMSVQETNRSERLQRILVGVVGLAVILLAAAFGSLVISALSDPSDPGVNKAASAGEASSGEEPLVGLGVVPGNPDANATAAQAPAPMKPPAGQGQSVPPVSGGQ